MKRLANAMETCVMLLLLASNRSGTGYLVNVSMNTRMDAQEELARRLERMTTK